MKGIVGKKLGMTQVFDEETGQVTPVTVIEAGPCPVVSVKTADVDGYDAVQVAYGEVVEDRLSKPKLGHLKKNQVGPHKHLVELRDFTGATEGEAVTVDLFEPGDKVKVSGVSIGKGFAGTIKRHNFGHAVARVQGDQDGRPPRRQAGDPDRIDRSRRRPAAEPAARQGRRAGPEERDRGGSGGDQAWRRLKHPYWTAPARSRPTWRSTSASSPPR
jgi:large subunit ribosomal protein L3